MTQTLNSIVDVFTAWKQISKVVFFKKQAATEAWNPEFLFISSASCVMLYWPRSTLVTQFRWYFLFPYYPGHNTPLSTYLNITLDLHSLQLPQLNHLHCIKIVHHSGSSQFRSETWSIINISSLSSVSSVSRVSPPAACWTLSPGSAWRDCSEWESEEQEPCSARRNYRPVLSELRAPQTLSDDSHNPEIIHKL